MGKTKRLAFVAGKSVSTVNISSRWLAIVKTDEASLTQGNDHLAVVGEKRSPYGSDRPSGFQRLMVSTAPGLEIELRLKQS